MRRALIVAALSAAFMVTADADELQRDNSGASAVQMPYDQMAEGVRTGTIISVNETAKTFVCEWDKVSYTYKVTDKTTFRARGKDDDFSDVKVGVIVNIGYQVVGQERVADWVTIEKR